MPVQSLLRLLPRGARSVLPGLALTLCACTANLPADGPTTVASLANGPRQMVERLATHGMPPRLLVAADIGQCNRERKPLDSVRATAALLEDRPGLVLVAGDIAYPDGRAVDFGDCYDPAWGSLRTRTLPVPGNHEYHVKGAEPYFEYFGRQAGNPAMGWYSVDFAGWHIVALNSNLPALEGSVQLDWLRSDLAHRPVGCLAAFWHHPRFSSGGHGNNPEMDAAWQVLAQAGADIVLNGHDHDYERFAPLNAQGRRDPAGVREFVVGTGGAKLTPFAIVQAESEVRSDETYGILELNLRGDSYDWRFLGTDGAEFEDRGSAGCHPQRG
jgi:hypothetical protein